jgi:hypothetical protein
MDWLLGEAANGLQVIDPIHAMFPEQKFIIVSGHAPNDRTDLAIKKYLAGLPKPYDIEGLAHAVATVLLR